MIAMLAVPILLQVYLNAGLPAEPRHWQELHAVAAPSALIGASNFFEAAVAAAPLRCSALNPAPRWPPSSAC